MKRSLLLSLMALGLLVGPSGCTGDDDSAANVDDASDDDGAAPLFELLGTWIYTGGFAGLTNTLEISEDDFLDTGDYQGTPWVIRMAILSWDNEADQAQLEIAETEGFSHYEVGAVLYSSWQLDGDSLRLYTSEEGFVAPNGGTEGEEVVTYTRSE